MIQGKTSHIPRDGMFHYKHSILKCYLTAGFANFCPFSVKLQAVDIRQIYDKFPEKKGGLKELYDKGPQPVFFLVKFWVSLLNFYEE